jgi:hypothetical protein
VESDWPWVADSNGRGTAKSTLDFGVEIWEKFRAEIEPSTISYIFKVGGILGARISRRFPIFLEVFARNHPV